MDCTLLTALTASFHHLNKMLTHPNSCFAMNSSKASSLDMYTILMRDVDSL
jgi:hypothetical protein